MLEFVRALHEAFHTESRWLFVLYMGITFALAFGVLGSALAYVVDTGYQRSLREQKEATANRAPGSIIIRDMAEEDRLRSENKRLQTLLDTRKTDEAIQARARGIQQKLSGFIQTGIALRSEWLQRMGQSAESQRQEVGRIQAWQKSVEDYLKTIPRGDVYAIRFQNQTRGMVGYPEGINVTLAGWWDMLSSDLSRLNEFLTDPDLGKP